nr:hypothetical protein [Tanacetum cinerariifolium]
LNLASFLRTHETVANPFTNVGDEPLGGSFHMSPPRSTLAPPIGQTSGSAEDLITLTALSSVVFTLMQKVNSLETELKDHKKLFKDVVGKLVKKVKVIEVKLRTSKRKMVVSDSYQEEGGKQDVDLNALLVFANAVVTVNSNISPGGASDNLAANIIIPADVPTGALNVPTSSTSVPADVPTSVAPAGVSNKGKALMVEEDIPAEANASLFKTLLGDDVSKDNFPARMAALIKRKKQALAKKLAQERKDRPMTQGQQRTYMRQFKVNSLETELKDHKKLFKDVVGKLVKKVKVIEVKLRTSKRKMVVSDSDQEEGGKQDVDLNALLAFANAVVTVDSNISPGGASDNLAASIIAAKRLHAEEQALVDRQRAELQRRRQQEVLASAMYYTKADWINIMAQAEANASLFKTLLGDDVSKDNFPARMAALIKRKKKALTKKLAQERKDRPMTQGQQRTYMRQFVKN